MFLHFFFHSLGRQIDAIFSRARSRWAIVVFATLVGGFAGGVCVMESKGIPSTRWPYFVAGGAVVGFFASLLLLMIDRLGRSDQQVADRQPWSDRKRMMVAISGLIVAAVVIAIVMMSVLPYGWW